jgi:hypothetical protein
MDRGQTIIGFGVLLTHEEWKTISSLWKYDEIMIGSQRYESYCNFKHYFLCDPLLELGEYSTSGKLNIENRESHQVLANFCKEKQLKEPNWYVFVEVY